MIVIGSPPPDAGGIRPDGENGTPPTTRTDPVTFEPGMNAERVSSLCAALDDEPLLHLSLHSRELFHSNVLAWFINRFPDQAHEVFGSWFLSGARGKLIAGREVKHYDLLITDSESSASVIVENKVFSALQRDQLDRYAKQPAPETSFVCLSLLDPKWEADRYSSAGGEWTYRSYHEIVEGLASAASAMKQREPFAGDVLEHYANLIRLLLELCDVVARVDVDSPIALPTGVRSDLEQVRLHGSFAKLRSHVILGELTARAQKGTLPVQFKADFTNGQTLIEGFVEVPRLGDQVGWQLQGTQFRRAVIVGPGHGRGRDPGDRARREEYVRARYPEWFNFGEVARELGVAEPIRPYQFLGFKPAFVYQYCRVPDSLTVGQFIQSGLNDVARASELAKLKARD
jgi:hypothetical protein